MVAIDNRDPLRLPSSAWGYVLAACFFVVEFADGMISPSDIWHKVSPLSNPLLFAIVVIATIYFLYCVYGIHRVLAEVTHGTYPIKPIKAAGFHLIPIFCCYWVFAWTNRLADFIKARSDRIRMRKGWAGAALLLAPLLMNFDGAIGIAAQFGVLQYIASKLNRALQA